MVAEASLAVRWDCVMSSRPMLLTFANENYYWFNNFDAAQIYRFNIGRGARIDIHTHTTESFDGCTHAVTMRTTVEPWALVGLEVIPMGSTPMRIWVGDWPADRLPPKP
jgi:hypothetical protein